MLRQPPGIHGRDGAAASRLTRRVGSGSGVSATTQGSASAVMAAMLGLLILSVGLLVLTTWEIEVFRATTADRDFTGLVCGTPLDNPGWETGSPCHGAVNRQTAAGVVLVAIGLSISVGAVVRGLSRTRPVDPSAKQDSTR